MSPKTSTDSDEPAGAGPRRAKTVADRFLVRAAARAAAVAFVFAAIALGAQRAGHFDDPASPLHNLSGRIAGYFGQAAEDISIYGLTHHDPGSVLAAIAVRPNGSLIGFNPVRARNLLENLDWVERATVQRIYPNQLEIAVVERQPFAIWQRDGEFYVIDRSGFAISSLSPDEMSDLLIVTGEGAQIAVEQIVNHLEAVPALKSRVRGAARVGGRRWNLYLRGGARVALPASGVVEALQRLQRLADEGEVLERAVSLIDLRWPERTFITPEPGQPEKKLSQR